MTIGVLKEPNNEKRVSLLPEHIVALKKQQVNVIIEKSAGENAFAADAQYEAAGATVGLRIDVLQNADIVLSIHALHENDIANCKAKILFGFYQPLFDAANIEKLAEKNFTIFSIDMLPRTTRAQSMDVL
ncbi:MAG: NAD(P)(+) transhydrogenase (Re/Si-specific) subunit alpha, partial [Ferruginibacter sp.]|nr:NAD(P)(+) transhydrogenase (Re/Si-specific) subunit alpha [Ferruginibacter sp.]